MDYMHPISNNSHVTMIKAVRYERTIHLENVVKAEGGVVGGCTLCKKKIQEIYIPSYDIAYNALQGAHQLTQPRHSEYRSIYGISFTQDIALSLEFVEKMAKVVKEKLELSQTEQELRVSLQNTPTLKTNYYCF